MTGKLRRCARRLLILLLVIIVFSTLAACQPDLEESNNSARSAVTDWCRLAPFPSTRANEKIVVSGSSFTRGFEVWFTLSADELDGWIQNSPGLQDATVETSGDITTYLIKPKDAAYGLVRINKKTGEVYIKTYWS